jgi:hypothetical protein
VVREAGSVQRPISEQENRTQAPVRDARACAMYSVLAPRNASVPACRSMLGPVRSPAASLASQSRAEGQDGTGQEAGVLRVGPTNRDRISSG